VALAPNLLKDMKDTLLAGRYSLFLGAGASFGSKDHRGTDLPLSEQLRTELVTLKKLNTKSSLHRAYGQLSQGEVDTYITDRFENCEAGPALLKVPTFIWKRIYTSNIDDCLESAYTKVKGHQVSQSKTHRAPYVDAADIDTVQLVHFHGWAKKPEDGYIFSLAEYANAMGPNSPWTSVLAVKLQDVVPGQTESADRWLFSEASMRSVPVVAMQP
jgi:hypothetical protein